MTELEQEIERKIEAITRKIEIEQSLHSALRTALETYLTEEDTRHENHLVKLEKEKKINQAMLSIKDKYGKNAILKGMNFVEGATGKDRNEQIGGHKA